MAIIPIRVEPDPVLRQKSKRVRFIDGSIQKLIGDMFETMYSAPGVGLAAPQIGVPLRVIVIGVPDQEEIALINPEIVRRKGERIVSEGCLSVPDVLETIKRKEKVTVRGLDEEGKEVEIEATGMLAICLQHEIDHLNGTTIVEHLSPVKRDLIRSKLKKAARDDS